MSHDKIIRMANQIATFFESASDEDAPQQTAEHINQFWEPRMRTQLFEVAKLNPTALHKIVVEGLGAIAPVADIPTEK